MLDKHSALYSFFGGKEGLGGDSRFDFGRRDAWQCRHSFSFFLLLGGVCTDVTGLDTFHAFLSLCCPSRGVASRVYFRKSRATLLRVRGAGPHEC